MRVAAVIVNYNDADSSMAQLERIANFSNLDKIILVDNASCDDSRIRLRHYFEDKDPKRFIWIQAKRNGGYGVGNNLGVRRAAKEGMEYALIANPDTVFQERVVERLRQGLEQFPKLGALAPVMYKKGVLPGSRRDVLGGASCWPLRPWLYSLLENGPLCRRIFTKALHYPSEYYIGASLRLAGAVAGSLLMVRIKDFLQAGGYDEGLFLYGEEESLARRMKKAGFLTGILTKERYIHENSVSIDKAFSRRLKKQRLKEKSLLYYFKQYLHTGFLAEILSVLFFKAVELEILGYELLAGEKSNG